MKSSFNRPSYISIIVSGDYRINMWNGVTNCVYGMGMTYSGTSAVAAAIGDPKAVIRHQFEAPLESSWDNPSSTNDQTHCRGLGSGWWCMSVIHWIMYLFPEIFPILLRGPNNLEDIMLLLAPWLLLNRVDNDDDLPSARYMMESYTGGD